MMPDTQKPNDKQLLLIEKIKSAQPATKWTVLGVRQLREHTMATHVDAIRSLESDLDEPEAKTRVLAFAADPTPLALTDQGNDAIVH